MRKQLDPRLPTLIINCALTNQRSLIILVGDKSRDQIVNLHFLLSQARVSSRPNVLWCYKKDLGFTSHRKKREAKIKREVKQGRREANEQNPFELFVTLTDIRYCYYKETQKVLGQTFGMLVLQDFEALTPNLWARTVETVQGGGMVVVLLKTMRSLRQLYTMTMDVHARYRRTSSGTAVSRFNERFILSLGSCPTTLVLDDELNVLPISSVKDITPLDPSSIPSTSSAQLHSLKDSISDESESVREVVDVCKTADQARGLLAVLPHLEKHELNHTVSLTSARGRGKSSLLGLSLALALHFGFSNIFVTSPHPSNLKSLFEFLFKGLDKLGWEEHLDYDIRVALPQPGEEQGAGKDIVRVDLKKKGRQTIQYIHPRDAHKLSQAELLVVDEAAAIPLPLVKALLGPYLVILSSTINGYEGTGRSLSLKLIAQLRESSRLSLSQQASGDDKGRSAALIAGASARKLHEVTLDEPIRYALGDPVEAYLSRLLLLSPPNPSTTSGTPHPRQCNLYCISRDTLFSFHPVAEKFLERCWGLYVAAHYKNAPDDLMLLSDAPAQRLFVLCKEIQTDATTLPEPLCVIQVAMEGRISRDAVMEGLRGGIRGGGDLIPWLISQQYQDDGFGGLSGARVVRIATHPEYNSMGYGARALDLLRSFFGGELLNLEEAAQEEPLEMNRDVNDIDASTSLQTDKPSLRPITSLPPLLRKLTSLTPEPLDYLGVSYGLTAPLLKFWKRAGYVPLYVRQTENELTGECTCVMLKPLRSDGDEWLAEFAQDYRKRFLSLLSFKFREFPSVMSLSLLEAVNSGAAAVKEKPRELDARELVMHLTPFDIKRLESYASNMLDYHVVLDLIPVLSNLYFLQRVPAIGRLSGVQASILLSIGLQRKTVEEIESELGLPVNQVLALFIKVIRKLCTHFQVLQKAEIGADIPEEPVMPKMNAKGTTNGKEWKALEKTVDEELEEAAVEDEETRRRKQEQRQMIDSLDLSKYAINDAAQDWSAAEKQVSALTKTGDKKGLSSLVSVKSTENAKKRKAEEETKGNGEGKRKKDGKKVKRV
ncbi:N-acetyltransferase Nat10 [Dacryopinax primogenitus]|uniref:RNA cytidine acetyltransferase n=1 Tax=Dacryopinax primogenitus (strain DJM 731) TaxID=1858805 RepID=M5G4Y2_DACPD|nr:N-acetyltransferase Nat10 [Dacryopinax primogenitus]EJT98812.1 N-acetyltransferase Nat10 [Dacryopinax primogenitus]